MLSLKENNPQIVKLNANNYSVWKFKMEMILIKEDLFHLIEDDTPSQPDEKYIKKDRQARAIINLCIEDSQIIHIKYETTAKATWNNLKTIHERSNLSSKLFLLRKLYATKMSEDGNMNEHISQMLELIDKLKAVGEEIKDDHIAALLLVSVPKSYDTLITALEARPENELTPELIKNKLTDEYNRRKEQVSDRNLAQAFKTNVSFKSRNQNKNDKFCTFCKRPGHLRDFCYHLNKNYGSRKRFPFKKEVRPKTPNESQGQNRDRTSVCMQIHEKQNILNETKIKEELQNKNDKTTLSSTVYNETNPTTFITDSAPIIIESSLSDPKHTLLANADTRSKAKVSFFIDSGASQHLINDKRLFSSLDETADSIKIIVADGKIISSQGIGKIYFQTITKDGIHEICLQNAYYLPQLECNLLSVKRITEKGFTVNFNKNECVVMKDKTVYLEAISNNNSLYEVIMHEDKVSNHNFAYNCNNHNCLYLWHKRLGHRNINSIKQLVKENLADGIQLDNCQHIGDCIHCIKNKLSEFPYPKEAKYRATHPLDLVHSDLCGPMPTQSVSGKHYILTFVDDYSRYSMIYLLSKKDEVLSKLKEYIAMTRNKFGRTLKVLRSDNGGEYIGKEIEDFLKEQGIVHQLTVPYSPQQNGVSERKNRTLIEITRCLLSEANLPQRFWAEAAMTATYLQNRLPTKPKRKTPYELWTNRKPNLSHIRVFGCKAYAYIQKQRRGKLDSKAVEGIFLGYDYRSKGYRIYLGDNKIMISRTVKFIENPLPYAEKEAKELQNQDETTQQLVELELEHEENHSMEEGEINERTEVNPCEDDEYELSNSQIQTSPHRRSERKTKGIPPERFAFFANPERIKEPKSWNDVLKMENPYEKQKWIESTKEEMKSLQKNETWKLVTPPSGKKVIGCRWTFKAKYDSKGNIERYKARLVAQGFSQKFGTDYDETFAPVVTYTTIRTFLAAAAYKNLNVTHVDIKTAFLHGNLEDDMSQPEGYIQAGQEQKVCKLNKAIYGLKQAARAWHLKIGESLIKYGFEQSKADPCLFKFANNGNPIYIIVYVDDLLIAGKDEDIRKIIKELEEEYELKNLGEVNYYLGINIERTKEGNFALNRKNKIEEIVEKFNLKEAKPTNIPMDPNYLKQEGEDDLLPNNTQYRKAVGALLYIATVSRPDIAVAVNILSRRNEKPRERDWNAVKRIIRYLKTTAELKLIINVDKEPILTAFCDADWANDKSDRKSTSGSVFKLGNCTIQWMSKRQNCVALSSTEAEYVSAANTAQVVVWLINLTKDLDLPQSLPVTIYEDNQSCIKLSQSDKHHSRTKHIDVKFHHIRHLRETGMIELEYCQSKPIS
ncbi:Retrovirus-related Pol polyprotein from transposon TNT 1-94 [Araneus ventricosus]|uniref:Retrovirus-related Pol polyprotein from transposon TNT 1-94 n=1 Tax=Araneus ventricosus TaxID=182803 RepID=A0A4Y2LFH2_ARAVE|nr:Retrovirus-related Pol polyprotein from transposon TNT 1-94 [Araneus ventricosus]GBN12748.1 Retrovirus-related Pol polyprotein from transposon TNT 1-94 [Araneus ventricosus]